MCMRTEQPMQRGTRHIKTKQIHRWAIALTGNRSLSSLQSKEPSPSGCQMQQRITESANKGRSGEGRRPGNLSTETVYGVPAVVPKWGLEMGDSGAAY